MTDALVRSVSSSMSGNSDLVPGQTFGLGNLTFRNNTPGSNRFSTPFSLHLASLPTPGVTRYLDVSGQVRLVGQVRLGMPGCYAFVRVDLYSMAAQKVVASSVMADGSDQIGFYFGHMPEGNYRLDVTWKRMPGTLSPEALTQWELRVSAVARS